MLPFSQLDRSSNAGGTPDTHQARELYNLNQQGLLTPHGEDRLNRFATRLRERQDQHQHQHQHHQHRHQNQQHHQHQHHRDRRHHRIAPPSPAVSVPPVATPQLSYIKNKYHGDYNRPEFVSSTGSPVPRRHVVSSIDLRTPPNQPHTPPPRQFRTQAAPGNLERVSALLGRGSPYTGPANTHTAGVAGNAASPRVDGYPPSPIFTPRQTRAETGLRSPWQPSPQRRPLESLQGATAAAQQQTGPGPHESDDILHDLRAYETGLRMACKADLALRRRYYEWRSRGD